MVRGVDEEVEQGRVAHWGRGPQRGRQARLEQGTAARVLVGVPSGELVPDLGALGPAAQPDFTQGHVEHGPAVDRPEPLPDLLRRVPHRRTGPVERPEHPTVDHPGGPAKSQAAYDRTGSTVPNTCEVVDKILYRGSKLVTLNARRTTTSTPGSSPTTG
ncbi:hypothetical protein ACH4U3_28590 [Streptomyces griseoruber]|uniref:hypothetical protein n=1 Tax=Streptomyces griseoruber TaxID=1943 RepID=UPI003799E5AA